MESRCSRTPTQIRTGRNTRNKGRTRLALLALRNSRQASIPLLSTSNTTAAGSARVAVDGKTVAESRIEQTSPVGKFTLDESFDVGQDTGTPVIDDYETNMPFKFTGKLEKVEIKLGPDKLTPQQRGELEQLKRDFALSVQ